MNKFNSALEAKIGARNAVHLMALEMIRPMREALRPFLGKKVLNQGEVIRQAVKDALPKDGPGPDRQWWYRAGYHSIRAHFKTSTIYPGKFGDHCCASYAECSVHLADRDQQTLSAIAVAIPNLRTDYSVAEIKAAREELKAAQHAVSEAQSKIQDFGEYEN